MQFTLDSTIVIIQGMQGGNVHLDFKKQLSKLPVNKSASILFFVEGLSLQLMSRNVSETSNELATIQLQELLQQYAQLFEEPTGLPFKRDHDHQIPLTDDKQVVKIRPYRYPTVQKDAIEKLVNDMKLTGII